MSDLSHLPSFYGNEMSIENLDGIMAFAFSKKDLEEARSLYASKWFDYRFIHPGHSLYLYCHFYGEAIERWRSKFGVSPYYRLDHLKNPVWRLKSVNGKQEYILSTTGTRTSWLRGVMFADHYGIPYNKWIDWCFQYAFDCNWQKMPLPGHLYGDKVVMYILARWREDRDAMVTVPADPRFLAANYVGHPWQDQCQDWLLETIATRTRPEYALRNFLYNEPLLTEERARAKLGDDIVQKALL